MTATVLVADDDRKTVELIVLYLQKDGYRALTAHDGQAALATARAQRPDLIVLDWMLPKMDGLSVCRLLRAEAPTPIIMLTARVTEEDKLLGLELGADDYVVKPFSPRELLARIRVVLRRARQEQAGAPTDLRSGDLTIDFLRHEVRMQDQPVRLTPTEFRLLAILARQPGRVFTREQLLDQVFGVGYDGFERTIVVHLSNLRRKIELDPDRPKYLQTVFGVGYRFLEHREASHA